jgi:hypothetical protein
MRSRDSVAPAWPHACGTASATGLPLCEGTDNPFEAAVALTMSGFVLVVVIVWISTTFA